MTVPFNAGTQDNSPFKVAVIGIGCRLPGGANDPTSFWQLLLNKGTGIREIPTDRWNIDAFYDPDHDALAKGYAKAGGFIDDLFGFDPNFFDISPREAQSMDPQQRLLLKVAIEAIEDSNSTLSEVRRRRCGVFVGISNSDFGTVARYRRTAGDIWAGTGTAFSIAANRISHRLNLSGPSIAVDTACSSALVAIDQACRYLREGNCDVALAGGVNAMLEPSAFVAFSKANMLSPTNTISPFDKAADGFVRGEGAGLVLLKPLEQAYADNDRIYAVIRATTVNQDGFTSTITAPSFEAQASMLEDLCRRGQIQPDQVDYVEAHGTGTQVGDPMEARAIGRVFGRSRSSEPLPIGSVKANLGHLEAAAGICGFIKAALISHHGVIAPTRNFRTSNPNIPMDALNIRVPTEPVALGSKHGGFIVVNSFGFGGTNASVLVERVFADTREGQRARPIGGLAGEITPKHGPSLFPISAATANALKTVASRLSEALKPHGTLAESSLDDVMGALALHRDHHAERAVLLAYDRDSLIENLALLSAGELPTSTDRSVVPPVIRARARPLHKLAFTFAGQGGQWWGMGRRLLTQDVVYRRKIEEFDEIFKPMSGWSVVEAMLADEESSRVDEADVTQPAIFANQIGLAARWMARGVEPDYVIGHSFGEVAAAYTAGCISLETAAKLIHFRGLVRIKIETMGAMATVGLSADQLAPYLPADQSVVIAAYNGPTMHTLSGDTDGLTEVLARITADQPTAFVRRLKMDFGWHSPMLDEGESWFRQQLGPISWNSPKIPIISSVTGRLESRLDQDYWWRNLREPVSFDRAIRFALGLGVHGFLELGPHRTLAPLTTGIAQDAGANVSVVNSLHRDQNDHEAMAHAVAALHAAGFPVDWRHLCNPPSRFVPLPKHVWEDQILASRSEEAQHNLFVADAHPLLGKRDPGPSPSWSAEINLKAYRYVADHAIQGNCVFPAAGYVEILVAAAIDHYGQGAVELENIRFHEALSIGPDDEILFKTELNLDRALVRIFSMRRGDETEWRLRAEGYVRRRDFTMAQEAIEKNALERAPDLDHATFYELADRHGLNYQRTFKGVQSIWLKDDASVLANVTAHESLREGGRRYVIHPSILDSCLQVPIALIDWKTGVWTPGMPLPPKEEVAHRLKLMLPIGIRRVLVATRLPHDVTVQFDGSGAEGIYTAFDSAGVPVMRVEGLITKELGSAQRVDGAASAPTVYVENFYPIEHGPRHDPVVAEEPKRWLIIGPKNAALDALTEELASRGIVVEHFSDHPGSISGVGNYADLLAAKMGGELGLHGIVYAWGLAPKVSSNAATAAIVEEIERDTIGLVELGKALDHAREKLPRPVVWVVTKGARKIDDSSDLSFSGLQQSALCGLTRSVATECAEFIVRQLDIDEESLQSPTTVSDWLLDKGDETEIVLRQGKALSARIERREIQNLPPRRRRISRANDARNFGVTMSQPGLLENIVVREIETPEPELHEVVVEVAAVGLNFRDVMAATSILPDEIEGPNAWWRNFGLEFAGTVRALGSQVKHLAVGDRVMGMGRGFLRRFATVPAAAVMRVPDALSLAEAASIPAGFATSVYALEWIGRLEEGEKVLIHLGSGGVGLAAIQVARHLGAEVLATAGNDTKREFLRSLGVAHVMDSRSLTFADDVMAATGGRGVDVVLNSLAGLAIDKGLACLAPYGRFIEIGKRDLFADKPIGLKALYRNNAFSVIDLAALGQERPKVMRRLLDVVSERFEQGVYRPIVINQFPVSETSAAFRTMSKGQHIGKIIIDMTPPVVEAEDDLRKPARFDMHASYIVTGGLRGFGVSVADWLSQAGAGRIVLVSRRTVLDDDVSAAIAEMKKRGTDIVLASLDVTDGEAVASLVSAHVHSDKPLRGVIHGAAVIDDGFLSQLDAERIRRVIRPKVAGAWNLHCALEASGAEIDFFTSFSSLAQMIGSAGQGNYTAANAFLDAFSAYRKDRGLPANTVDWGALGDIGFVARNDALMSYLDSVGMKMISSSDATNALGQLMRSSLPTACFAAVDWQRVGRIVSRERALPRLSVVLAKGSRNDTRVRLTLAQSPREAWHEILISAISRELARVLKVDAAAIPVDRPLTELGLDSLSSFELKNRIEAMLDLSIPVGRFLQAPTIQGLAKVVAASLEAAIVAAERAALVTLTNGAASASEATGKRFQPLPRQISDIQLSQRPMTSETAVQALLRRYEAVIPRALDLDTLESAIRELSKKQDALRLAVSRDGNGKGEIGLGDGPRIERLDAATKLHDVNTEAGPLWAFGLALIDGGRTRIQVRSHSAAADAWSMPTAVSELLAQYDHLISYTNSGFQAFVAERQVDESEAMSAHVAYWREVLGTAPAAIGFGPRSHAIAPAGLGRNSGPPAFIETKLEIGDVWNATASEREATLLWAFARAVLSDSQRDAIVISRNDWAPRQSSAAALLGPIADRLPIVLDRLDEESYGAVRRVERCLAHALSHRAFDVAAAEEYLGDTLRERNVVPTQIGFAYVDATGDRVSSIVSDTVRSNPLIGDLELLILDKNDRLECRFAFDTEVISRENVQSLSRRFARDLHMRMNSSVPLQPVEVQTDELESPPLVENSLAGEARTPAIDEPPPAPRPTVRPVTIAPPAAPIVSSGVDVAPASMQQSRILEFFRNGRVEEAFNQSWIGRRALLLQPGLDANRMRRAIQTVVERHESLRMRFVYENDAWGVVVDPPRTDVFVFEDVGPIDTSTRDALIANRLAPALDPFTGPMLEIRLLRMGAQGDALLVRGHHLVLDGWSLAVVLSEVFQGYIGMSLPEPSPMTHRRFLREFTGHGNQKLLAEREAYFAKLLLPPTPLPNLGRAKKGLLPNNHDVAVNPGAECIVSISRDSRRRILERAKGAGVTDSALFLASYAMTIGAIGGVDEVQINVPAANRPHRILANYVGWVAAMMPVRCSLRKDGNVDQLARDLHTQCLHNAAHLPIDFAALNYSGSIRQQQVAAGAFPKQFVGGMLMPEGIMKVVPVAPLLFARSDEAMDFGVTKITPIPLPAPLVLNELELRTYDTEKDFRYIAIYDQTAFSNLEVVDIIQQTFDRLTTEDPAISDSSDALVVS